MECDIRLCRLLCAMLEGVWHERVRGLRTALAEPCSCTLCGLLPEPPRRDRSDYRWRGSEGRPLTVKIWPYRTELNSVLTAGWVWLRKVNDHEIDLNLRNRYEDDIVAFHEYKRTVDEYWIRRRHQAGTSRIPLFSPFDIATYILLQLFDCLLWHFSPDSGRKRSWPR